MTRLATLRRRVADARRRRRVRLGIDPPTPHPSPAWGCFGCGADEADVRSLVPLESGEPCDETYCWDCVPSFYPGARYEVFPGRQRPRAGETS